MTLGQSVRKMAKLLNFFEKRSIFYVAPVNPLLFFLLFYIVFYLLIVIFSFFLFICSYQNQVFVEELPFDGIEDQIVWGLSNKTCCNRYRSEQNKTDTLMYKYTVYAFFLLFFIFYFLLFSCCPIRFCTGINE